MRLQESEQHKAARLIQGVPTLGWDKGKAMTFLGALEAALSVTPYQMSYADLLGYSGLAFRTRWWQPNVGQGCCPSSCCVGEYPEEISALRGATGWELRLETGETPDATNLISQITTSIDVGLPVIAYDDGWNMAVIVGYEDGGDIVLMQTYEGGLLRVPLTKVPYFVIFLGDHREALGPKESPLAGLSRAISNWGCSPVPKANGVYFMGQQAFEAWACSISNATDLEDGQYKSLFFVNRWNMETLIDARLIAAPYLRSISINFPDEQASLLRAASIYDEETELLRTAVSKGNAFLAPWTGKTISDWTPEMRIIERDLIRRARVLEATAIAELITQGK